MAELDYAINAFDTDTGTTSLTYVNVDTTNLSLQGADLSASQDYFLITWLGVNGANGTENTFEFRITDDAGTELVGSHHRCEPRRVAHQYGHPYLFIDRITTDASPGNYDVEFKTGNATHEARCGQGTMLAMAVGSGADELAENTDLFWNEDNTSYTSLSSSAWQDGASVTVGDGSDDYLVFFNVHSLVNSTSAAIRYRLKIGASTFTEFSELEGEDVDEEYCSGGFHFVAAPAASTTITLQFQTDTASTGAFDVDRNAICAIRLNKFAQYFGAYSSGDGPSMAVQNTWYGRVNNGGTTVTTSGAHPWLGFGFLQINVGDNNKTNQFRMADDGTVSFFGAEHGDGTSTNYLQNGASDIKPIFWFDAESIADAYTWSMDIDVRETNTDLTPNPTVVESSYAFFSADLVAGTTNYSLTPTSEESATQVESSALTQVHDLTATDEESTTQVESSALTQVHSLTATDEESATQVESSALTQVHGLTATDEESATEVSAPVLSHTYVLSATDEESATEVSSPALTQVHSLSATDEESATEVSSPTIDQVHSLTATDEESATQVESSALTQVHSLTATDEESATQVESSALTQAHDLTATDEESATEVSSPAVTQVHDLTVTSVESATEVDSPALGGVSLEPVSEESVTQVDTPALTQVHSLSPTSEESATEVSSPVADQTHVLSPTSEESATEVTSPTLAQVYVLSPASEESITQVDSPALTQVHDLTSTSEESVTQVDSPTLTQVYQLTPVSEESATEVTAPSLAQVHVLSPTSEESATEASSPSLTLVYSLTSTSLETTSEVSNPIISDFGAPGTGDNLLSHPVLITRTMALSGMVTQSLSDKTRVTRSVKRKARI